MTVWDDYTQCCSTSFSPSRSTKHSLRTCCRNRKIDEDSSTNTRNNEMKNKQNKSIQLASVEQMYCFDAVKICKVMNHTSQACKEIQSSIWLKNLFLKKHNKFSIQGIKKITTHRCVNIVLWSMPELFWYASSSWWSYKSEDRSTSCSSSFWYDV